MTSNNQKEAEIKRKPPSEPICCTTTGLLRIHSRKRLTPPHRARKKRK
jgi:hypothetical protein